MATAETVNSIPWWKEPTKDQWYAWWAAWLGWTLDAFDFTVFLLIIKPIADEFHVPTTEVAIVFTLTLWMRLVGAVASGWLADRIGRKTPLMISIFWYSICNFIAGFSPTFLFLLIFRTLLGIGMGAEWPAGAALAMESWPNAFARLYERGLARLVEHWLSAVERDLRIVFRRYRLARHVVDRRLAGAVDRLHPLFRQGTRGLGREPPSAAYATARGPRPADQDFPTGHARQHATGVLVDGEQLCPLLLDLGAVRDASAAGSEAEHDGHRSPVHGRQHPELPRHVLSGAGRPTSSGAAGR